jgi:hypothetical protein
LYALGAGARILAAPGPAGDGEFRAGNQTELFRTPPPAEAYAPERRGNRFLIARPAATAETVPLEIVTNPLSNVAR